MILNALTPKLSAAAARGPPRAEGPASGHPKYAGGKKGSSSGSSAPLFSPITDNDASSKKDATGKPAFLSRRSVLSQGSATVVASFYSQRVANAGEMADSKMVGAYLPEAADAPGFNVFTAGPTRTPALRAGALLPYQVLLPAQWKEAPVSNARSGNYCQPRCDEATTEVQFVDPGSGSIQIIIIPTTKLLIAKQDPSIEDVGTISGLLDAISPAITGSVAVEAEEVTSMQETVIDGKTYYKYELLTPFAESGVHNLAAVSTSKNYVMIATLGASEKQWSKSEQDLKKIINSFRVVVN